MSEVAAALQFVTRVPPRSRSASLRRPRWQDVRATVLDAARALVEANVGRTSAGKLMRERLPGKAKLALAGPTIDIRARVARIVQDSQHTVTLQLAEDRRPGRDPDGIPWRSTHPRDLLLPEVSHPPRQPSRYGDGCRTRGARRLGRRRSQGRDGVQPRPHAAAHQQRHPDKDVPHYRGTASGTRRTADGLPNSTIDSIVSPSRWPRRR